VTQAFDNALAVVVLPAVRGGRLADPGLRRWIARGRVSRYTKRESLLTTLLSSMDAAPADGGAAALRMWGQTGDRPTAWIAAADPVYLEPRLDHLRLHALGRDGVPAHELRTLVDHLQQTLGSEDDVGFATVGSYAYLRPDRPLETAALPPGAIDGALPDDFMPANGSAARYRGLVSEIEMALHDHPVNVERQARGVPPVNALWLWGGGHAPQQVTRPQPPLFADDPVLRGHWLSLTAVVEPWPGTIQACLEASVSGFVAVVPERDDTDVLSQRVAELRTALMRGRLERVVLLFRDGVRADVRRADAVRFWRRRSLLDEQP